MNNPSITPSTYYPEWQQSRIDFILSKYPEKFFKDKTILELAPFNGYIGAYFQTLGAKVHCVEGRQDNVNSILNNYPLVTAECKDLDSPEWGLDKYDIIINFGLYYHLEKYHKEHLVNCIKNCSLMFFETVVHDSKESKIYLRPESGGDQSLTDLGGNPTTSYIEDILKQENVTFTKYIDSSLNGGPHHYDWEDKNSDEHDPYSRRFWIIEK
jgi:hypothetical protein